MRTDLIVIGLLLLAASPAAAASPDVSISPDGEMGLIDWGIYDGVDTGETVAENTVAGVMHTTSDLKLVKQATDICAQKGTRFGIRYRLDDQPGKPTDGLPELIDIVTEHPLLQAPSGRSGTRGSYRKLMRRGTRGYTGWSVDLDYERVPGDYTFTLLQNNAVLLRKTLHVSFDCTAPVS